MVSRRQSNVFLLALIYGQFANLCGSDRSRQRFAETAQIRISIGERATHSCHAGSGGKRFSWPRQLPLHFQQRNFPPEPLPHPAPMNSRALAASAHEKINLAKHEPDRYDHALITGVRGHADDSPTCLSLAGAVPALLSICVIPPSASNAARRASSFDMPFSRLT